MSVNLKKNIKLVKWLKNLYTNFGYIEYKFYDVCFSHMRRRVANQCGIL